MIMFVFKNQWTKFIIIIIAIVVVFCTVPVEKKLKYLNIKFLCTVGCVMNETTKVKKKKKIEL